MWGTDQGGGLAKMTYRPSAMLCTTSLPQTPALLLAVPAEAGGPEIPPFPPFPPSASKDSDCSEASGRALGLQVKSGGAPCSEASQRGQGERSSSALGRRNIACKGGKMEHKVQVQELGEGWVRCLRRPAAG